MMETREFDGDVTELAGPWAGEDTGTAHPSMFEDSELVMVTTEDSATIGVGTARSWAEGQLTVHLLEVHTVDTSAEEELTGALEGALKGRHMEGDHVLGMNADLEDVWKVGLLGRLGYQRVFTMVKMEKMLGGDNPEASVFDLRALRGHELDQVWQLQQEAYAGRAWTALGDTERHEMNDATARQDAVTLLAWDKGVLTGFAYGTLGGDTFEVQEVSVHPRARRRGIALALMNRLLGEARARGAHAATLVTNGEDICGARTLYTKAGFEVIEQVGRFRKRV